MVASGFEAEPEIDGTRSDVVVAIHLGQKLALIAGTRYAGEIKKTVFTVLNYLFPLQNILPDALRGQYRAGWRYGPVLWA